MRGLSPSVRTCSYPAENAMKYPRQTLEQIFQTQIDNLSLTLQPFTIVKYQYVARYFVSYLRADFPEICRLSQLRRDPHMLGFFRWLCELRPPIGNQTRRATSALPSPVAKRSGRSRPPAPARSHYSAKIFPHSPRIPPQSLYPRKMIIAYKTELRREDNLYSNALLLTRLTGIRIGECIHLPLDCLRHSDRNSGRCMFLSENFTPNVWCPSTAEGLRLLKRILELRAHVLRQVVWRNPKTSSCFEWAAALPCFKCCAWRWRIPPNEQVAPTANLSRLTACGTMPGSGLFRVK